MIDWFAVLAPLALLPIVMLFVFVGCELNTQGTPIALVALVIGKGYDTDVQSVEVTFQYTLYGGESPSNLGLSLTLQPADLTEGNVIDKTDELKLESEPKGTLTCTCIITKMQTFDQFAVAADQFYNRDSDESELVAFKLLRKDSGFQLVPMWPEFKDGY